MADRKSGAGVTELPDGAPDATGLTPRQLRVLAHIKDSIEKRGYPPSMREIGQAVGLTSTSSVAHQLRTLEEKGFIKRDPNRPRAMQVFSPAEVTETGTGDAAVNPMPAATYVPMVGRIEAASLVVPLWVRGRERALAKGVRYDSRVLVERGFGSGGCHPIHTQLDLDQGDAQGRTPFLLAAELGRAGACRARPGSTGGWWRRGPTPSPSFR